MRRAPELFPQSFCSSSKFTPLPTGRPAWEPDKQTNVCLGLDPGRGGLPQASGEQKEQTVGTTERPPLGNQRKQMQEQAQGGRRRAGMWPLGPVWRCLKRWHFLLSPWQRAPPVHTHAERVPGARCPQSTAHRAGCGHTLAAGTLPIRLGSHWSESRIF